MIPPKTQLAIQSWEENGTHPSMLGSFVRALLTNDLREAVAQADPENLDALPDTVRWIYWNVAGGTYGSIAELVAYHERKQRGKAA